MTTPAIRTEQDALKAWLVSSALPLWWNAGGDPAGGFHELLSAAAEPVPAKRRCFTMARQTYVYSVAARFGWDGRIAARHGLDYLLSRYRRDDGLFATAFDPATGERDDRFDLYDQAFVLFTLAVVAQATTDGGAELMALETLAALRRGFRHPHAGFEEADPPRAPLRANPHMHLFEAALEWLATAPADSQLWDELADELAELCLARFIDPATGALHEFFDADWRFAPGDLGRIVEPGHQFEWAWLLARWAKLRGRPDALAAARRMAYLAEVNGVRSGLAINELWDDLAVKDEAALLWPQTERIKAWVVLAQAAEDEVERQACLACVVAAASGLRRYLSTPVPGLWFKAWSPMEGFAREPAPARYLYHIVCAIHELLRLG